MPGPEGSAMLVPRGPAPPIPPVTPAHLLLTADLSEPSSEHLTDPGAEGGAEAGAAADAEAGAAADEEAAAAGCLGASANAGLAGGTVIAREPMPFGDLAVTK